MKNVKLFSIFNFLLDFRLFAPILILYMAEVTGSFALGMSIFSLVMVSAALFELPTGVLSDMVGRKKTIVFGALMSVMAVTFYALGGNYWVLALGAVFEGISRSFFSGNNDAMLYESLKEEGKEHEFAHYSGRVSSMFQAALAVGSLLGGFLAMVSFSLVMWLSILPQIGGLITSFFMVEPKVHTKKESNIYAHIKESLRQFHINKKLRLLTFASTIGYAFGEAGFTLRTVFISTVWPVWAIGLSRAGSSLGGFIGFYLSGSLIKKYSPLKILVVENLTSKIINGIALLFPSVLSPALMTLTSLFYGPGQVARGTLMQKEFTNEQRATMGSLNSLAGSMVFGIVAVVLGYIADQVGPIMALLIAQGILLLPLYFYSEIFKHDNQKK